MTSDIRSDASLEEEPTEEVDHDNHNEPIRPRRAAAVQARDRMLAIATPSFMLFNVILLLTIAGQLGGRVLETYNYCYDHYYSYACVLSFVTHVSQLCH